MSRSILFWTLVLFPSLAWARGVSFNHFGNGYDSDRPVGCPSGYYLAEGYCWRICPQGTYTTIYNTCVPSPVTAGTPGPDEIPLAPSRQEELAAKRADVAKLYAVVSKGRVMTFDQVDKLFDETPLRWSKADDSVKSLKLNAHCVNTKVDPKTREQEEVDLGVYLNRTTFPDGSAAITMVSHEGWAKSGWTADDIQRSLWAITPSKAGTLSSPEKALNHYTGPITDFAQSTDKVSYFISNGVKYALGGKPAPPGAKTEEREIPVYTFNVDGNKGRHVCKANAFAHPDDEKPSVGTQAKSDFNRAKGEYKNLRAALRQTSRSVPAGYFMVCQADDAAGGKPEEFAYGLAINDDGKVRVAKGWDWGALSDKNRGEQVQVSPRSLTEYFGSDADSQIRVRFPAAARGSLRILAEPPWPVLEIKTKEKTMYCAARNKR